MSAVSIAEIEAGIAKLRRQGARRRADDLTAWLDTLLHLYAERVLPFEVRAARIAGGLADRARSKGQVRRLRRLGGRRDREAPRFHDPDAQRPPLRAFRRPVPRSLCGACHRAAAPPDFRVGTAIGRDRAQREGISALRLVRWRPAASKLSGPSQRSKAARTAGHSRSSMREPGGVAVAALDHHVLAEGALVGEAEAPRRAHRGLVQRSRISIRAGGSRGRRRRGGSSRRSPRSPPGSSAAAARTRCGRSRCSRWPARC